MIPAQRRKARRFALQGLYEVYMSGNLPADAEKHLMTEVKEDKVDVPYLVDLLHGTAREATELDAVFIPYLKDVNFDDLTPIELCVLRMATYELKHHHDVPYQVVINEALELTKRYGAEEAHKFVNGVLDKLVSQLRPLASQGKE